MALHGQNVSGIAPIELTTDQQTGKGSFTGAPQAQATNTFANSQANTEAIDMNARLANIQAIKASTPMPSDGIAQGVGTIGGGIAGGIFGGGPAGAAAGSAAGGALGSIVDNLINKRAKDRARKKELNARRKELSRQKKISAGKARREEILGRQGIAAGNQQQRMTESDLLLRTRENSLSKLMGEINNKANANESIRRQFLSGRTL